MLNRNNYKDNHVVAYWNMLKLFIKPYVPIFLGTILMIISLILFKSYHFNPEFEQMDIMVQKSINDINDSRNVVNNVAQQQIYAAHRRHFEVKCSIIRALVRNRNPLVTVTRLETALAKATTPYEIANLRKIIECFKEKPGPNDKLVEDYIRNRKRGK